MRLLTILLLLLLVPLAACRQAPVPEQPTAAPPVVPSATPIDASPAVTSAPTDQIFVPVAPGEAVSATTGYPAPSPNPSQGEGDSTATPAPPTPTPEPAYPEYTGPPLNRDEVGIQIYLHRQDVRDLLRHFQALGVGWVKVQVSTRSYLANSTASSPGPTGRTSRCCSASARPRSGAGQRRRWTARRATTASSRGSCAL